VTARCPAASAIAHLLAVRDALELAARPPGDLITIERQTVDSILNDIGRVARLIREISESPQQWESPPDGSGK
jgi:hypothetical protein